jgi:hypothetical protein
MLLGAAAAIALIGAGLSRSKRPGALGLQVAAAVVGLGAAAWTTARTTNLDRIDADLLFARADRAALISQIAPRAGERFFSVDWKRDYGYDFRRGDLPDAALPNLARLWGYEDVGGYEPARGARYERWLRAATDWPMGAQPWSAHFALVYPPHPLDRDRAANLARANPVAAILPRWGLPATYANEHGPAPAPDWREGGVVTAVLLAPSDDIATTAALTIRQGEPAIAERFSTAPDPDERSPAPTSSGARLAGRLVTHRVELSPYDPGAPQATIELEAVEGALRIGAFVWDAELDRTYPRVAEAELVALHRVESGGNWAALMPGRPGETGGGAIEGVRIASNRIELSARWDGAGEAILEIHDAYWKGWRARVDGRRRSVEPSGADGRGPWRWVRLPPGESTVVLTYRPPGLQAALALMGIGGAMALILGRRSRRRISDAPQDFDNPLSRP